MGGMAFGYSDGHGRIGKRLKSPTGAVYPLLFSFLG